MFYLATIHSQLLLLATNSQIDHSFNHLKRFASTHIDHHVDDIIDSLEAAGTGVAAATMAVAAVLVSSKNKHLFNLTTSS